jgi:hypothetical protein
MDEIADTDTVAQDAERPGDTTKQDQLQYQKYSTLRSENLTVLQIRIRMFLVFPDSLVRGADPDPSIIKKK